MADRVSVQDDGARLQQNFARNRAYVRPGVSNFVTSLAPQQERAFQQYLADKSDPQDIGRQDSKDYDMRGWWLAHQAGDPRAELQPSEDGYLHRSDYWKTPFHESFSNESQWATPTAPRWDGDKLVDGRGNVVFQEQQQEGYADGGQVDGPPPDLIHPTGFAENIRNAGERSAPNAVSPKGAMSSMQVMPATAANPGYGVKPIQAPSIDEFDRTGDDYANAMQAHFGNRTLAAAAYNAGPGRVNQWIQQFGDPRKGDLTDQEFAAKIPYQETRDYVGRVVPVATSAAPPAQDGPPDDLIQPPPDLIPPPVAGKKKPIDTTALGTFIHGAERGALPAAGGYAGMLPGAGLGAALVSMIPVIGETGVANIVGGLVGGGLGAYFGADAVAGVQKRVMDALPDSVKKLVGQDAAQQQAESQQHPYAEFAGELAPNLALVRPGAIAQVADEGASTVQKLLGHPVTARGVGATLMGGQEAGQEEANEGHIDPGKVAIAAGIGALSNRQTKLGSAIESGIRAPFAALRDVVVNRRNAKADAEDAAAAASAGRPQLGPPDDLIDTTGEPVRPDRPGGGGGAAPPGAPPPDSDIGLKNLDGSVERATVKGYSPDGKTVHVEYEDGSTAEHLTNEVVRDLAPAPANKEETPPANADQILTQEERNAPPLEGSKEVPPSARAARKIADRAPQPVLDPQALHALDMAGRMEASALDPTVPMSNEDRQAALMQAARLRQKFSTEGEETVPGGYKRPMDEVSSRVGVIPVNATETDYQHPMAAEPAADLGELAISRLKNPQLYETTEVSGNVPRETDTKQPVLRSSDQAVEHDEAASDTNLTPTERQKDAGNYAKGKIRVSGIPVSIETPRDAMRGGVSEDGQPWENRNPLAHYGYITRTGNGMGADGEHIDAYVGQQPNSPVAYVVDQVDPKTGNFDEHKSILGVRTQKEAKSVYNAGFSDGSGPKRMGAITKMPMVHFKDWLKNGDMHAPLNAMADPDYQAALMDVRDAKSKAIGDKDLLGTIQAMGGIKLTNHAGDTTPEGQTIREIVKDYHRPGLINNRSGMTPDYLREALTEQGWFGDHDAGQTDVRQLYDLLDHAVRGTKVYHPESDAHNTIERRGLTNEEMDRAGVLSTDSNPDAAKKLLDFRRNGIEELASDYERATDEEVENLSPGARELLTEYGYEPGADYGAEHEVEAQSEEHAGAPETVDAPEPEHQGQEHVGQGIEEPAGGGEAAAEIPTEPGAEGREQTVIPGAEHSAKQLAESRESSGHGRASAKVPQKEAAGLFAPKLEDTTDMFGEKPPAKKTKYDTAELAAATEEYRALRNQEKVLDRAVSDADKSLSAARLLPNDVHGERAVTAREARKATQDHFDKIETMARKWADEGVDLDDEIVKSTEHHENTPSLLEPNEKVKAQVYKAQTSTPEFKKWFNGSKVVDAGGKPIVVYHGTQRPDRIGDRFRKSRATSGPMSFFSEDPEMASSYSTAKSDTSLYNEDSNYESWFKSKVNGARNPINIDRLWWDLTPAERDKIAELAPRVSKDDETGEHLELKPEGYKHGLGGYDQHIKETRGNHLKALVEEWLNSGALFNDEEEFSKVLKMAGLDRKVEPDFPHAAYPAVIPVYLSIKNPLDTSNLPTNIVTELQRAANRQRSTGTHGADIWAKTSRRPADWMSALHESVSKPNSTHAFTSIPDWVTNTLKKLGYDGVKDTGGKNGGKWHNVWVPFEETQVKSASGNKGTFDPNNRNIRAQEQKPFYSALTRGIEGLTMNRAPGSQWSGVIDNLRNKGVKQEEIDWSGVKPWLAEQQGPVTKDALVNFLRDNEIQIKEITYSDSNKPAVDPRNVRPELGPQALERLEELQEKEESGTITPSEQQLYDWLDANPGASDIEYLTREYDIWLGDHPHHAHLSADELIHELNAFRDSGEQDRSGEIDADIRWLSDFSNRWEEAENREHADAPTETVGRPRYSSYKLPGGENYRELLLTLNQPKGATALGNRAAEIAKALREKYGERWIMVAPSGELAEYHQLEDQQQELARAGQYKSGHWDEPNILAHVRFDDRTGPDGEKILHVAEIQSDWHQAGRKIGYGKHEVTVREISRDELVPAERNSFEDAGTLYAAFTKDGRRLYVSGDLKKAEKYGKERAPSGVPDAPFKTTWPELAFKRMLRYAAENGYYRLSWDTGDTNADRYDLSKHVSLASLIKNGDGTYNLTLENKGGWEIEPYARSGKKVTPQELEDVVGKDVAQKLIEGADKNHGKPWPKGMKENPAFFTMRGLELRIGGEGMRGFYDDILPKFVSKYVKKWGGKVERGQIQSGKEVDYAASGANKLRQTETPVHSLTITDAMRESVMQGQPMFQVGARIPVSNARGNVEVIAPGLLARLPKIPTQAEAVLIEQINKLARQIVPTAKVIPASELVLRQDGHTGSIWGASYVDGPRKLIAWALGSPDAVGTFRHEAVHYLRNVGFFTPKEWGILTKAAEDENWIAKHDIDERYPTMDHADKIEEAVAEEFSAWKRLLAKPQPPVRRLLARIGTMLEKTRKYLHSLFGAEKTADDIFADILDGKVGMRPVDGERAPDAKVFAQAAKTPEGPVRNPEEGRDYIDHTAEDIAEHMREKGPGTYERTLQHLSPPTGPELFLSMDGVVSGDLQKAFMGPRTVAEIDTKSGRFWNALKAEEDEGHRRLNDLRDHIAKVFLKLDRPAQDRVNAVMEIDRLANRTRGKDGRSIVATNEHFDIARGSRPGERIVLSPKETGAYFELQNMYRKAWDNIMEGTARRMGWIRPWSPAMADNIKLIQQAVETADNPRNRKAFQRVADVMQAMDEQRRAAYMPLMRFGDYYVSVKPKIGTDLDSTGGFPKTVWFELVERPSFQYSDVDPMKLMRGDVTKTGEVPVYAKDKIAELQKRFPPAKYTHETGYLMNKPDALRNLSIPAVEKLLMLLESGVLDRLKADTSMGGSANKKAAREEAVRQYQDLYGELIDAVQEEMYENLKAGFKKKSNTIGGYNGDWNRVLGSYMNWTSRHVAKQIHGDNIERIYDDIQTSHPHKSIKEFWKRWKQADENPLSPLSRIGMGANQLGFLWTLAWNPASTLSIMMHGPNYAMPVISTGIGMDKAGPAFTKAYGEATIPGVTLKADTKQGAFIDISKVGKTPDERAYLRKLEIDGDLHAKGADDVRSMAESASAIWGQYGPHMKRSMDIVSSNIASADQANRVAAALAAYRLARDGNLGRMNTVWSANQVWRAIAQQDGVSPETMGKFLLTQSVGEWGGRSRTQFGRSIAGRMTSALHGFQVRYLSNLAKQAFRQGPEGRTSLAWSLAALWAVAGLQGLPFVQDAENFMDGIWQKLTKHDPMLAWRMRALLADTGLGKVGADLVLRGPLSVITGADFASRLGFGKVITDDVMPLVLGASEAAMTFPSIVMGAFTAAHKRAASHQPESAAAAFLPAGLRHPVQAAIDAEHGVKSQSGKRTYVPAKKFSAYDQALETVGLTPLDVARAREKAEYQYRAKLAHGPRPKDMTP